eukprot:TRINITY_DN1955_c0_g1_i1.p2 TRINITY_DN1955_c0_g1~~TRINITY_DN1955_c0_g1_i1.p2  ORF type:complete len:114 (-),score=19.91 TRINITY_DN1955_c0_g1_i1:48-389(-)
MHHSLLQPMQEYEPRMHTVLSAFAYAVLTAVFCNRYDMEKTAHSHHFHSKHATEHAGVHHHGGFDKHSLTHLLREQGGLRDVVVELAFVGEKPNHEDHEGMMQFNVLCAFGRK